MLLNEVESNEKLNMKKYVSRERDNDEEEIKEAPNKDENSKRNILSNLIEGNSHLFLNSD
jgi:hypothetical protein